MKRKEQEFIYDMITRDIAPLPEEGIEMYKEFLFNSISIFKQDLPQLWSELTSLISCGLNHMQVPVIQKILTAFNACCKNFQPQIPLWIRRVIENDKQDGNIGISKVLKHLENNFASIQELPELIKDVSKEQITNVINENFKSQMKKIFPNLEKIKSPNDIDLDFLQTALCWNPQKAKDYESEIKKEKEKLGLKKYDGRIIVDTICDYYEAFRYINGFLLVLLDAANGFDLLEIDQYFNPRLSGYSQMFRYKNKNSGTWRNGLSDLHTYLPKKYPTIHKFLKYYMNHAAIRNPVVHNSLDIVQDRLDKDKWAVYNKKTQTNVYRSLDSLIKLNQDQYYFYIVINFAILSYLQTKTKKSNSILQTNLLEMQKISQLLKNSHNSAFEEVKPMLSLCAEMDEILEKLYRSPQSDDFQKCRKKVTICKNTALNYQKLVVAEILIDNLFIFENIAEELSIPNKLLKQTELIIPLSLNERKTLKMNMKTDLEKNYTDLKTLHKELMFWIKKSTRTANSNNKVNFKNPII